MKKTKFQVIRKMLEIAKRLGVEMNKADVRISYIIQCHEFFIWKDESEFISFIEKSIERLKKEDPIFQK